MRLKRDKTGMLGVDRVADHRSWAILARDFFVKNETSLNSMSTCLKVVDTRRTRTRGLCRDSAVV
jgi:hypothetical protein